MLQGSLDNFGLDEVLGLLADTAKTGRMRITGDRGSGSLWLASGQLIESEASRADAAGEIDETMFELLRFKTGNFSFNSDELPPEPGDGTAVATVLEAAFERLTQWRDIEAVVPSLAHVVAPVSALPAPEMTITAAEWDLLMAIGAGAEVGTVCEHFGLGEVEGSRRVKLLVERSLISIAPPSIPVTPAPAAAELESLADTPIAADSDDFGLAPAGLTTDDDIATPVSVGAFDATPTPAAAPTPAPSPPSPPASATSDRFGADALGESPAAAIPTESGFLDPADRAWNPLSDVPSNEGEHAPESAAVPEYEAPIHGAPAYEAPIAEAHGSEAPEHEVPASDAAFDSTAFDPTSFESPGFDASVPPMPEEHDLADADVTFESDDANEFSFRPDPPSLDQSGSPLRRASDAIPPPPPAPPSAFEQFDAAAPPPPAPPSPADLVGSERIDGAEARRLLSGRGTERYDSDDELAPEDDDGSLLMQYLRDES